MPDKYFRGFHAIGEVAKRAQPLAAFMATHHPESQSLRIARSDFDLVARWPKAAALHGFEFGAGQIKFMGFNVIHNNSTPRYGIDNDSQ